jgi:hypothetical protein
VKTEKENTTGRPINQGGSKGAGSPAKINADTRYEVTTDRMTAYGGLLALIKFLELVQFKEIFLEHYHSPSRKPALGCYRMVVGFLALLFVGFARVGHFFYLRYDAMICGWLEVEALPVVSTFWRYLFSLQKHQSQSLLTISARLRSRVWEACQLGHSFVAINVDTTVSTVYGKIEGARKGHNSKHRGKKALRPVLLFIEQTREYLIGEQRRGETMSDAEVAQLIRQIPRYLPSSIRKVLIRGDAEFIGPLTLQACEECGFFYVFANKSAKPAFAEKAWYRHQKHEYNESTYAAQSWNKARRFVIMRIQEENRQDRQLDLLDHGYLLRCFVTNLRGRPHAVIAHYDQRATIEASIKEAQQEGLLAIPSRRFWSNHAFFQIIMLAYNLWRWMRLLEQAHQRGESKPAPSPSPAPPSLPVDHTIRITRLKLLFVPAKITHSHRTTIVKYSHHDARAAGVVDFMAYLDKRRAQSIAWRDEVGVNLSKKAG